MDTKRLFFFVFLLFCVTVGFSETTSYDFSNPAEYVYDGNVLIGNGKAYLAPNFNSEAVTTFGTLLLEHYENTVTGCTVEGNVSYEDGKFSKSVRISPGGRLSYPAQGKISRDSGTVEFWLKPYSNANFRLFKCAESGENWNQIFNLTPATGDSVGIDGFEVFKNQLYASASMRDNVDRRNKMYRSDATGDSWSYVSNPAGYEYLSRNIINFDTPGAGDKLYAIVEHYAGNYGSGRVYSSSDGLTWVQIFTSPQLHGDPFGGGGPGYRSSCVYNGKLYVGTRPYGNFTYIDCFDGSSWDTSFSNITAGWYVESLFNYNIDGKLYASINTGQIGAGGNAYVYRFDGTSWASCDTVTLKSNQQIAEYNGKLYIAQSGGSLRQYDGSSWQSVVSPYGDDFISLCAYNNKLYIGGRRDNGNVYTYDGTNWAISYNTGNNFDSSFNALKVFGNKLYAGSGFPKLVSSNLGPNAKIYRLSGIRNGIEITQTVKDYVDFIITDSDYNSTTLNIPVEYFAVSEWHHWAFTWSSSEANVYRDGVKIKSYAGTVRVPLNVGTEIVISENMLLNASMDDLKISNYAKVPSSDTGGKIILPEFKPGERVIPAYLTVSASLNNGTIGYRAITNSYSHTAPQDITSMNSYLPQLSVDTVGFEVTLYPSADKTSGPEIDEITLTYVKASSPFIVTVTPEKITKGQKMVITANTPIKLKEKATMKVQDSTGTYFNVTVQEEPYSENLYKYKGEISTKDMNSGKAKVIVSGSSTGDQTVSSEKEIEILGVIINAEEGGTVEIFDADENPLNNTAVVLPKNLLPGKKKLQVSLREVSSKGVYDIEITDEDGRQVKSLFLSGIELRLHYDYPELSPEEEKNLAIYYWDGVRWVFEGGEVDIINDVVKVKVYHLSKFAVLPSKRTGGLVFYGVSSEVFSPNSDGINDFVKFQVDNPMGARIEVKIYDISGKLVRLLNETYLIWDGRDANGNNPESGVYVFSLQTADFKKNGVVNVVK